MSSDIYCYQIYNNWKYTVNLIILLLASNTTLITIGGLHCNPFNLLFVCFYVRAKGSSINDVMLSKKEVVNRYADIFSENTMKLKEIKHGTKIGRNSSKVYVK